MNQYRIPNPCSKRWDEMSGGNRVRSCQTCRHAVHNFSALTRREVERFTESSLGKVCAMISYNPDGSPSFRPDPPAAFGRLVRISLMGLAGWSLASGDEKCRLDLQVTDTTGAVVGGADVTISREGGLIRQGQCQAEGQYSLMLPTGLYSIRIQAPGFQPFVKDQIDLSCPRNEPFALAAKLDAAVIGGVIVEADAHVETEPASVSSTLEPRGFLHRLWARFKRAGSRPALKP
jgi:hypothetical protein